MRKAWNDGRKMANKRVGFSDTTYKPTLSFDTTLTQKVLEVLRGELSYNEYRDLSLELDPHELPELAKLIVEIVNGEKEQV
jgi:hypothetical protein